MEKMRPTATAGIHKNCSRFHKGEGSFIKYFLSFWCEGSGDDDKVGLLQKFIKFQIIRICDCKRTA